MGSDVYRYIVLSLEGREVMIEFHSGQSVGLADLTAAFWVDALCCAKSAFVAVGGDLRPSCSLTRHELFRLPTRTVRVEGGDIQSLGDVEALVKKVSELIHGKSSSVEEAKASLRCGQIRFSLSECDDGRGDIEFQSVQDGRVFIDSVTRVEGGDEAEGEARRLDVFFPAVRNGPEHITRFCEYSDETFQHFVESVELVEVYYESVEVDGDDDDFEEKYWNTKAKYRVVMKAAEYLDHLTVGDRWEGQ